MALNIDFEAGLIKDGLSGRTIQFKSLESIGFYDIDNYRTAHTHMYFKSFTTDNPKAPQMLIMDYPDRFSDDPISKERAEELMASMRKLKDKYNVKVVANGKILFGEK